MSKNATIAKYDQDALAFAERHSKQTPTRLYQLVQTFFIPDATTLDVGSGIGRDTEWLNSEGYPTTGIEPATGMREKAKKKHPKILFIDDSLPELKKIKKESVSNVFVCAVLMHIPSGEILNTVFNLLRITKPKGKIIVSYRHGKNETDERHFENYNPEQIAQLFASFGGKLIFTEKDGIWFNLVVEKSNNQEKEGLSQVQSIINFEDKNTSYKFALLRALCEISKYEPNIVIWKGDSALLPLDRISARWLIYYLPLIEAGVKQNKNKNKLMAFETEMRSLKLKSSNIFQIKKMIDEDTNKDIARLIKKISNTIVKNPIKFTGGKNTPIFRHINQNQKHGQISVPAILWREISQYPFWIEDSLSIQWAEFTENLNNDRRFAYYLDLITKSTQEANRDTNIIRNLFKQGEKIECVWTGKMIKIYEVDHVIPWAIWRNNDIWNLLPSSKSANNEKRHRLPHPTLIYDHFKIISNYWSIYLEKHTDLFSKQIEIGLGLKPDKALTHHGRDAMMQTVIRLNQMTGVEFWSP